MRGIGRVKRLYRTLKRYLAPAAVILTYHRVVSRAIDPYGIIVAPDRFSEQLRHIQQTCTPIGLHDLVEAMRRRVIPRRAVALTFDDGYVDFYSQAYPRLADFHLPATLFVVSGHADRQDNRWHDELTHVLLQAASLPSSLSLAIDGVAYRWPVASSYERQRAHGDLYDILLPLPPAKQSSTLEFLARWAGVDRAPCADDRSMSSSELAEVARSGLVEIGAHTVTHPVLSALTPDEQCAEIAGSRRQLQALLDMPVRTFAYPYGGSKQFTAQTASLVAQAGFEAACTTIPGTVDVASDPMQLPRCWVGNWDLDTFRKNLEWYLTQ